MSIILTDTKSILEKYRNTENSDLQCNNTTSEWNLDKTGYWQKWNLEEDNDECQNEENGSYSLVIMSYFFIKSNSKNF